MYVCPMNIDHKREQQNSHDLNGALLLTISE